MLNASCGLASQQKRTLQGKEEAADGKLKKKKNRRESDQEEAAAGLLADGQKCATVCWVDELGEGEENAITAAIITQIRLPSVPLPAA